MKISKFVDQEDIQAILEKGDVTQVMHALNDIREYLNGVPDSMIGEMTKAQRNIVAGALETPVSRFRKAQWAGLCRKGNRSIMQDTN